jgi:hypothetical protein
LLNGVLMLFPRSSFDNQVSEMIQTFAVSVMVIAGSLLVSACSDYEVKFNNRPVYTPKPLFTDYRITDSALEDCVKQTIRDRQVQDLEQLTLLVCTNAGITSLEGLGTFKHLEQLNLAHNAIINLQTLTTLPKLRQLDLSYNSVQDTGLLATLAYLEKLNLKGNTALDCDQLERLHAITNAVITQPQHCDGPSD